jgi:hypothetical protein
MAGVGVLEQRVGTAPRVPPPERPRHHEGTAVLVVAFAIASTVTALGLRGHAMWFDELQAWNIARASHSIGDLYAHLRYEGHPIAWYLLLYGLTRFTGNPHAMQVLQWVIATATFAVVLFRAPFSIPMRVGIVAGYYFAFEYGVISRSYGLSALLALLAVMLLARRRPAWVAGAVVLGLLAWTSLPGAVLAVAVAAAVFLTDRARRGWSALIGLLALAAAATCVPPSNFSSFAPGLAGDASKFGSGPGVQLASAIGGAWRGLVPIPASVGEWNSNLLDGVPGAVWIEAALALLLFVVVYRALCGNGFARRLWWVGSLGYVVFFVIVILPEQARYAGFPFLLFVACAWFAVAPPGETPRSRAVVDPHRSTLGAVLVLVIAAQIVATIAVYPTATAEAFSRDEALARAVQHAHLENTIVSANDWDGTTVGGYLDRPVYSVARHAWIRYFVHDTREAKGFEATTDRAVLCAAAVLADHRHRSVAAVTDHRMRGAQLVARSELAAVYRVDPASSAPVGCASTPQ